MAGVIKSAAVAIKRLFEFSDCKMELNMGDLAGDHGTEHG